MAFFRKSGNVLRSTISNQINHETLRKLSYSTYDASLVEAFKKCGEVAEARVIVNRESGRSRGYGFVTYSSVGDASAAIQALDQQELDGRRIRMDYANDRARSYGGGGYRDGSYGG